MTPESSKSGPPIRARLVVAALLAVIGMASAAPAQYFIPFYGKNKVKYDKHDWQVYRSPHFDVYYYPEMEEELGRLVSYAESAYETISDELKHEIPFAIPLILYKTFSEFAQTNLSPSEIPEGVGAFAESARDRMVIPIDNPPDELQELFLHELTHIFEFDIVPRSLFRQTVPLWIDEGLSTYMENEWDPLDLNGDSRCRGGRCDSQLPGTEPGLRARAVFLRRLHLRLHGGTLREGGGPAVRVLAAPGGYRRGQRRGVRAGLPDAVRRVLPRVHALDEGAVQAVPGQGDSRGLQRGPVTAGGPLRRGDLRRAIPVPER